MTENSNNYSAKGTGKWDKGDDDRKKEEMRQKYLENQQKRKQLAIDNQKRRKERERQRELESDSKRRVEEEHLKQRKQTQDEAYLKYLRRNSVQKRTNLYDRYQNQKRTKKQQSAEIRSTRKWGDPSSNQKQKKNDDLFALDLDVHVTKDMQKVKKFYQEGKQQLKLLSEFQKQWQQSKDMISSSLLDSLDLDKNSILNSKAIEKKQKQPIFESYEKMKESFLSQDIQEQIKEDIQKQSHKVPQQQFLFHNNKEQQKQIEREREQKQKQKQQIKPNRATKQRQKVHQQLKDLIGFDSLDQSSGMWHIDAFKKKPHPQTKIEAPLITTKKQDKVQQRIQEQHKKVELMNWAPQIIQQVHESGVSSNVSKKPKRGHILDSVNKKIRSQKIMGAETKQEEKKPSKAEQKRRSLQQKKQIERRYSQLSQQRAKKFNKSRERSSQKPMRLSSQKLPPIKPNFKDSKYSNITAPVIKSTVSKDSRFTAPIPQSRTVQKFKNNIQKNTRYFDHPQTTCTQDDNIDMEQFIKDDLMDLNQRERQLQKQIKDIHLANRNKLKEVESKYKIQTGYKNTNQLLSKQIKEVTHKGITNNIDGITEDALQQSLIRLDEMLKKQDRKLNYLSSLPVEQQRRQSEDSLRVSDSLQCESVNKTKNPKKTIGTNGYKDDDLLSQIIKLAAKNLGQDENNVDLKQLKNQLSELNKPKQNSSSQKSIQESDQVKKVVNQQRIVKKDGSKVSYLQMMKIKSSANSEKSKQEKQQCLECPAKKQHVNLKEKTLQKQIQQKQNQQKDQNQQKISVNQRLRRLLLQ